MMKMKETMQRALLTLLFAALLPTGPAAAQTPPTSREAVAKTEQNVDLKLKRTFTKKKNGWFPDLTLGINGSMVHSSSVPGVDDGFTVSIGAVLNGALLYRHNSHEWKTDLKIIHTQAMTPALPEVWVKTADSLDLKSFYTYRIPQYYNLGIFGGLQLNTALFDGQLTTGPNTRVIRKLDKEGKELPTPVVYNANKNDPLLLTRSFAPLVFKQKLGLELEPFEDKFAKLGLRLNAAAMEVWASGLTVVSTSASEIQLKMLQDFIQAGVEATVTLSGNISKRIIYAFQAELMFPLITSIPTTLQGFDLLNADISFKVGLKLAKWASLDYVFQAKKIPLLTEKWQVTNNLVLSLKANIL